mmetsp:Transcript_29415/g.44500  ORF Transcript_29415/g.44500 Transcript_29415/m.44500 type:complete len:92 (+) Transcript_29415:418-693(+)
MKGLPGVIGTRSAAKAAAVDGPPIAAFDAVSTSCRVDCGNFLPMSRPPMNVPTNTVAQCITSAREANINAFGPDPIAEEMSAVVPTDANKR